MFLFALVGNTTYVARYAATLYNLFIVHLKIIIKKGIYETILIYIFKKILMFLLIM
jgi:hypothetical protein